MHKDIIWYKVLEHQNELPEGRVKTVVAGHQTIALNRFEDKFTALDNHCPHQGGPLGEGQIENGWLRFSERRGCTGRQIRLQTDRGRYYTFK